MFVILLLIILSINIKKNNIIIDNNDVKNKPKLGVVYPLFTKTAYNERSFYNFYSCYQEESSCSLNATRDLLHTELIEPEITDYMISTTIENMSYEFITDLDVHNNNITQFDTLIFFHSEYVTLQLYHNVVDFIQDGGKVVILSGNSFFAKIRYYQSNNSIQLLHGHSVFLNSTGQYEVDINKYWFGFYNSSDIENSYAYKYIGSRFYHYKSGIFLRGMSQIEGYRNIMVSFDSHEENTVINPNVEILVDWISVFKQGDLGVKTYLYQPFENSDGYLIHLGLYYEKIYEIEEITNFVHFLIVNDFV